MAQLLLGLRPAVDELLSSDSDWQLARHYTHSNGLTVLARSSHLAAVRATLASADALPLATPADDAVGGVGSGGGAARAPSQAAAPVGQGDALRDGG